MRDYVRRLLSGRYQVEAVADGEAALAAARANPPDLVLADVMMPRLEPHRGRPVLQKPLQRRDLEKILSQIFASEHR